MDGWKRVFRNRFGRDNAGRDVEDEIAFHLEMRERRLRDEGHDAGSARREALRRFGDVYAVRSRLLELSRHREGRMRRMEWWDAVGQDLRFAVRQLGKHPGGSTLAVLVLALGIGASTAVFSMVDAVVLSPLPFRAPERLVSVHERDPEDGSLADLSPPAYQDWRADARTLEGLVVMSAGGAADLTGTGEPRRVAWTAVSHDFFDFLGVPLALGRGFLPEEDRTGAPGAVVLSHELWRRAFGADRNVLGRAVRLQGRPHVVVGVAPAGFDHPTGTEAWAPLWQSWDETQRVRGAKVLQGIGRLRAGTPAATAEAELATITARAEDSDRHGAALIPLQRHLTGDVDAALLLLLGAVVLVLLVACANVGNLLLTRALARQREMAVRTALGASRARVAATLMAESLVVAVLAGTLGTLASVAGLDLLLHLAPEDLPRAAEVGVDGRVLAFALGVTLLTGLVTGLLPALRGGDGDVAGTLRAADGRHGPGRDAGRIRAALVVAQTAFTLVLLAGAGLVGRSLLTLLSEDAGFEVQGRVSVRLFLPVWRYDDPARVVAFRDELLDRLDALPGVEGVALSQNLPLGGRTMFSPLQRPGQDGSGPAAQIAEVSPGYFEVMGMRVRDGRGFTDDDERRPGGPARRGAAVLGRSAAEAYFGEENPLGQEIRSFFQAEMLEVVGVVDDVRHGGLGAAPPLLLYVVLDPAQSWFHVVLRTDAPAAALHAAVRETVAELDPRLPVPEMAPMADLVRRSVARPRFYAQLFGAFAGVTLLLAGLGLYAVMSTLVLQREREIGVRLALGAGRARVGSLVLGSALRMAGAGVLVGLPLALLVGRLLDSLLYGVEPGDPLTLVAVAALLVGASVAAVLPTLLRASRVDPAEALRAE